MISFFTRQLHDTVDDELGQRWCLGCGEFVFDCQCGYISLWRKLVLRLRRPQVVDIDPEYGPNPVYVAPFARGKSDEVRCTYCTRWLGDCECPISSHWDYPWTKDDYDHALVDREDPWADYQYDELMDRVTR